MFSQFGFLLRAVSVVEVVRRRTRNSWIAVSDTDLGRRLFVFDERISSKSKV